MRQAARIQRKLGELKLELEQREVSVTGLGERIRATATCHGRVRRIEVDAALLESEGLDLVLDAVTATVNSALELADKTAQSEMDRITGGVRIPGITG